jgi:CHASE3 domain sensor protein
MHSTPPAAAHPGRLHQWWLNRSVRAKGTIVVAVPLISLISITSASLVLQANERQVRTVARAASAVNSAAQQVMSDALNAETGLRGYAATDDPLFLESYNMVLARVDKDRAALRQAAVAEGDSRGERAVDAAMTKELAALAQLRAATSAGASVTDLKPALTDGKKTMDTLRRQIADLARGPAAVVVAGRAKISRMESSIIAVSIANLAVGVLAGVAGIALFTSGIARRLGTAVANADRLGGPGRRRAHSRGRAPPARADQRADRHRQDRVGRVQPVGGTGGHAAGSRGNLPAHGAPRRRPLDHDQPALPVSGPGGQGRPAATPPDPGQPDVQRDQVQPRRRSRRHHLPGTGPRPGQPDDGRHRAGNTRP